MNVTFFAVDNVLNFEGSEAKAPDGTMGIAESRLKLLKKHTERNQSKLVLIGSWKKEWDFDDSKCTGKGTYLNKKLNRKGIHILDKTGNGGTEQEEICEWLRRHPNVENYDILTTAEDLLRMD